MNKDIVNDVATSQTASGIPDLKTISSTYIFTDKEKTRLRELALCVAEIAALPIQQLKAKLWTAHNDLKSTEPLVFIDPENGWNECIPADTLLCTEPLARVWEMHFLKQIYWFEVMRDDRVIDANFDIPYAYDTTGWGVDITHIGGESGGAFAIKQAIESYEEDYDKVKYPEIAVDFDESERVLQLANEVFGDILNVRRKMSWWWTLGMTWDFINLRGLEDFMVDTITEPEWVHRLMNLICEGQLNRLDYLEKNRLLFSNVGNSYVGSGGFGFTEDLCYKSQDVTPMDMWGFVESQETVGLSPEAYKEFIFPYHLRMAERFGLNCYGCCEPVDKRWKYAKQLPRLRRVSYSPWADWKSIPRHLGKDYIASVKPSPTPLATHNMDEDLVRREARKAVEATKDCVAEFIMKDNHTLGDCPKNASRWVEIMREEISR